MSTSQQRGSGMQSYTTSAHDRELLEAKIDALGKIMDERDKQYATNRASDKLAVDAALAAQKELTATVNAASKEAIIKAESAQNGVNMRGNEFRASLDDYTKLMMPRAEASALLKAIEEKLEALRVAMDKADDANAADIKSLRESRAGGDGGRASTRELVSYLIAGAAILASVLAHFIH
jgi:hypothetical protein